MDHRLEGIAFTVAQGYKEGEKMIWKTVHYKGRRLEKAEKNYYKIEGESLAVYRGILVNRLYLLGKKFTVITDQASLIPLYNHPNKEATYRADQD